MINKKRKRIQFYSDDMLLSSRNNSSFISQNGNEFTLGCGSTFPPNNNIIYNKIEVKKKKISTSPGEIRLIRDLDGLSRLPFLVNIYFLNDLLHFQLNIIFNNNNDENENNFLNKQDNNDINIIEFQIIIPKYYPHDPPSIQLLSLEEKDNFSQDTSMLLAENQCLNILNPLSKSFQSLNVGFNNRNNYNKNNNNEENKNNENKHLESYVNESLSLVLLESQSDNLFDAENYLNHPFIKDKWSPIYSLYDIIMLIKNLYNN